MKKNKQTKLIAGLVAAIMVVQLAVPLNAVASEGIPSDGQVTPGETVAEETIDDSKPDVIEEEESEIFDDNLFGDDEEKSAEPVLQDGTAIINESDDENAVKEKLGNALVGNAGQVDIQSLQWEYFCEGKSKTGLTTNHGWGGVNGFETTTGFIWKTTYVHPALANNEDGEYKVRLAGTTEEVTFTKGIKEEPLPDANVQLKEGPYEVAVSFNSDASYNMEATKNAIYDAVIESIDPLLTKEDIKVEYKSTWGSFKPFAEGDKSFKPGKMGIRFSWDGTETYNQGEIKTEVNVTDSREESSVVLKENPTFSFVNDGNAMKNQILESAIDWEKSKLPNRDEITVDDFEIEYYAQSIYHVTGINGLKGWSKIEGEPGIMSYYPIMGAGEQKIKIAFKGSNAFKTTDPVEGTLSVKKANNYVKVRFTNIFPEEKVPADMVTTTAKDDFELYTVYAGVTRNVTTGIYVDLPDRYTNSAVITIIDPIVKLMFDKSISEIMNNGITIKELRELLG